MNVTEFRKDISNQLDKVLAGEPVIIERGGVVFKVTATKSTESGLVKYAEEELKRIGMGANTPDEMNKFMHDNIIEMVQKFADQGHSGFSANYSLSLLNKLMNYEPLTPLTGEDDEWNDVSEYCNEPTWQNKRCFSVFKGADGKAYNSEGKIFYPKGQRDDTYTNGNSRVPVTFPYTPTREYVEVDSKQ